MHPKTFNRFVCDVLWVARPFYYLSLQIRQKFNTGISWDRIVDIADVKINHYSEKMRLWKYREILRIQFYYTLSMSNNNLENLQSELW